MSDDLSSDPLNSANGNPAAINCGLAANWYIWIEKWAAQILMSSPPRGRPFISYRPVGSSPGNTVAVIMAGRRVNCVINDARATGPLTGLLAVCGPCTNMYDVAGGPWRARTSINAAGRWRLEAADTLRSSAASARRRSHKRSRPYYARRDQHRLMLGNEGGRHSLWSSRPQPSDSEISLTDRLFDRQGRSGTLRLPPH